MLIQQSNTAHSSSLTTADSATNSLMSSYPHPHPSQTCFGTIISHLESVHQIGALAHSCNIFFERSRCFSTHLVSSQQRRPGQIGARWQCFDRFHAMFAIPRPKSQSRACGVTHATARVPARAPPASELVYRARHASADAFASTSGKPHFYEKCGTLSWHTKKDLVGK